MSTRVDAIRTTVARAPLWVCTAEDCGGAYGTVQAMCACGSPVVSVEDLFADRAAATRLYAVLIAIQHYGDGVLSRKMVGDAIRDVCEPMADRDEAVVSRWVEARRTRDAG